MPSAVRAGTVPCMRAHATILVTRSTRRSRGAHLHEKVRLAAQNQRVHVVRLDLEHSARLHDAALKVAALEASLAADQHGVDAVGRELVNVL